VSPPQPSGTGSTPTATATYGANNGQSLTKVASAGGASQSLGYQASPAATAYLPQTSTDDASNAVQLGYDGVGNQTSSSTGSGTTAATSTLTYTAGQVATATAPGNGTNRTTYNYTNKQLTSITPVSITPTTGSAVLGARAYTYDAFGRIASASDGAGRTSYTYDGDDRVLTMSFSDGTPTVTNTYDAAGHLLTQASGSGTVTNTYDQLGHLLTTANTASPAALSTITYGYDKSGNQTSYTDQDGTVTSTYDASGVLTATATPAANNTTETIHFVTDPNGRRTDTYVDANADNSTFASHTHTDYDASGRIQELQGWVGPSSTNNQRIYDLYYCYNAGSTTPNCGTTTTNDRSKIQWVTDYQSGQSTAYTYDSRGRITKTVTTGSGTATPGTWEFGYDIRGNRTSAKFTTPGGSVTTNQTLTYNAANQITSPGFAYDGAGNLTALPEYAFTYNGAEQMTSAVHNGSQTTTYTYVGADQKSLLSLSTQGGAATTYQYGRADQNGNPTLTSSTRNGNRANVVNDAVTGQPIALATPSDALGQYAYDGSGNPFGLLTNSTAAFGTNVDPYGTQTVTYDGGGDGLVSNPFAFKTGIDDTATGMVKFGQRWYDPYIGAWTQQDTLDNPLDPSNGNRYAYAASDPINGSDPTGAVTQACLDASYQYGGSALEVGSSVGGAAAATVGSGGAAAIGAGSALDFLIGASGLPANADALHAACPESYISLVFGPLV
jgi:RHS repeat-associated protein